MNFPITKTFTADLITHGSWGSRDLGKHESTMVLSPVETRLHIEWDIPSLGESEDIGLTFEWHDGAWTLADYDGIMSLPHEAIEMLREAGYVVPVEFE